MAPFGFGSGGNGSGSGSGSGGAGSGSSPYQQQPHLLPGEERTLGIQVGLDLAQSVAYTAIVCTEVIERLRRSAYLGWTAESAYRVRDLQRLPHGVGYDAQAKMIVGYLAALYE